MIVECPSGLRGTVRGLKLKEFSLLSDAKLIRTSKLFSELASACWQSTQSVGPYAISGDVLPWDTMLQGDVFKVFFAIRCATFGDEYAFEHKCTNEMCGHKFEWVVNVNSLPVKELPNTSIDHVKSGKLFETSVDGKKVRYKLLVGSDMQKLQYLINDKKITLPVAQTMQRIVEVENVDRADFDAFKDWVENLDMNDGVELRSEMEAADCGIDTGLVIVCPRCENEVATDLPLGRTFFQKKKNISKS